MSIINQVLIITDKNNVYETHIVYENPEKGFVIFEDGTNLKAAIINGVYRELKPDHTGRGFYY